MTLYLPSNTLVWFAWIVVYTLFLCVQFYVLYKALLFIHNRDKENNATGGPGFIGIAFLIIFNLVLLSGLSTLYEVGLERRQNYILYKKISMFGYVHSYGIKDTKNNLNIQQYQNAEFNILLKEVFNDYDLNTNKYLKISITE